MSSLIFKKLNAYPEWKSKQSIEEVIDYVRSEEVPKNLNARQTRRFKEKFNDDFVVETGKLFYKPKTEDGDFRITLEIVEPTKEARESKLREIFEDETKGAFVGQNAFYNQVSSTYLNISKRDAIDWLKKQGNYQIGRPIRNKVLNKPVLASAPNEKWMIDILDMNKYADIFGNQQFRYIFTIVDVFSKKVWAYPLKKKSMVDVVNSLEKVRKETKTTPRIIQSDNAKEQDVQPKSGILYDWSMKHDVKFIYSTTYASQAQGLVERINGVIRSKIRQGFIKNDNLDWVEKLPTYVANINNQKPQNSKFTPNQLWSPGYKKPKKDLEDVTITDKSTKKDIQQATQKRYMERAIQNLDKNRPNKIKFEKGDKVRINMKYVDTEIRERYKSNIGISYNAVRYTPEIFTVKRVVDKTIPTSRVQYIVEDQDGDEIKQKFFGSNLISVEEDEKAPIVRTQERAEVINAIVPYSDDFKDKTPKDVKTRRGKKSADEARRERRSKGKVEARRRKDEQQRRSAEEMYRENQRRIQKRQEEKDEQRRKKAEMKAKEQKKKKKAEAKQKAKEQEEEVRGDVGREVVQRAPGKRQATRIRGRGFLSMIPYIDFDVDD